MKKVLILIAYLLFCPQVWAQDVCGEGLPKSCVMDDSGQLTANPVLGQDLGVQGSSLKMYGSSGQFFLLKPSALAGNVTGTLPNTAGVFVNSASLPLVNTNGLLSLNIGSGLGLSGSNLVLSNPLPNGLSAPNFTVTGSFTATGLVTNADHANSPALTLKGNNTASAGAPTDLTGDLVEKMLLWTQNGTGTIQRFLDDKNKDFVSVIDFGAIDSTQSTTCTINASSTSMTLGAAIDFKNGQGIRCNQAGASPTVNPPTAPSVANIGAAGATTYTYTLASIDNQCGVGAAITNFTTTTGNATLNATNFNRISWTAGSGFPQGYLIFGRISGSLTFLGISVGSVFDDQGQTAPFTPDWAPTTPPGAALNQCLITTIVSGAGTTSLIVANAAVNTVSIAKPASHDNQVQIQAAINALTSGGTVYFPVRNSGIYQICFPLTMPSGVSITVLGTSRGYSSGSNITSTCSSYVGQIDSSTAFLYGSSITSLTLNGNTLTPYNLDITQADGWSFTNLILLNAGSINFKLGDGTHNTLENTVYTIRIDNPLTTQIGNLPFYNFESNGTNNNYLHIKASNARTANLHASTTSTGNTWVAVHGYDFFSGAAQGPPNNWLIDASGEQITQWEADGSAGVNVQVNGSYNVLAGAGFSQYGTLVAGIGIQFATGTQGNIVTGNVFQNSTVANSIVQAGTAAGKGNVWRDNYANSFSSYITDRVPDPGPVPTNSGSCAINTQTGGNKRGNFKANGACAGGTLIFTFAITAPNGWGCTAQDLTTPADAATPKSSTTTTFTWNPVTMAASDLMQFQCGEF